jgi:hypothetical protein
MNSLLTAYATDVNSPEVSGAEHLELLAVRDRIAEIEASLSMDETHTLEAADQHLLSQARLFYAELRRFVDLAGERARRNIPPSRWWWYLDVVSELPIEAGRPVVVSEA